MVQLWDSCTRLGSSSNVGIPPRPGCPLMTRKYADWWVAAGRANSIQQNKIILKCSKRDDSLASSKVQQPKPQDKKKSSSSSKSKANVKDPSKHAKSSSKSTTPKGVENSAKGAKPLPSTSKTKAVSSLPQEDSRKRKDSPISLENHNCTSLVEKTLVPPSIGEVANGSSSTSSTEGDADQDHHWNRPKKKAKDLGNQSVEIVDLDNINITDDFFDEVPSSTLPLPELSEQLRLEGTDIFGDLIDEDGTISPTFLDISAKQRTEFSLDGDKNNVANEVSLIESSIPGRSTPHSTQASAQAKAEVVAAHVQTPAVSVPPSCSSVPAALNFEPQKAISSLKTTYASKMWSALCEWVTGFSIGSSDNFLKLENGVNLLLKEIKEIKVINTSALEEFIGAFFKSYSDYEAMQLCSSQKLTNESYQESLLGAQRRLHTANDEGRKMNEYLGNLQTTLGDIEKELQALNARREETLALITKQQEKLSKSRTSIIAIENEVQAIEKNPPLSKEDVEKLSHLKEALETSRQQILNFQPFP